MAKRKLTNEDIEDMLDEILYSEYYAMSIREVTKKLYEDYKIKLSPQIVLRHLNSLKKRKKVQEK